MRTIRLPVYLLPLFLALDSTCQVYTDSTYLQNIRTVQLFVQNLPLSDPVIPLGGTSQLHLSFDDLDKNNRNYSYTIIQCNYDWTPSALNPFDYLSGFTEQSVHDYELSFNTSQAYTHYTILFPDASLRITKSGNYIIKVYFDSDKEQVALTRRFIVFERMVEILSDVKPADEVRYFNTHHQVNFSILHRGMNFSNPISEVNVLLMQNFRWDLAIMNLTPQYIRPEQLDYNYATRMAFPAGKEFRYADIRTTRYNTDRVNEIETRGNTFLLKLFPDEIRNNIPYFYRKDLNGKFLPESLDFFNAALESDYVWVKFSLPVDYPLGDGKIFLLGQFTGWNHLPEYKMHFNSQSSLYETTVYLKQGYYDYIYDFISDTEQDRTLLEGNDYDTENTYQIFVYYHSFGSRYDRVIGYKATDSFNR